MAPSKSTGRSISTRTRNSPVVPPGIDAQRMKTQNPAGTIGTFPNVARERPLHGRSVRHWMEEQHDSLSSSMDFVSGQLGTHQEPSFVPDFSQLSEGFWDSTIAMQNLILTSAPEPSIPQDCQPEIGDLIGNASRSGPSQVGGGQAMSGTPAHTYECCDVPLSALDASSHHGAVSGSWSSEGSTGSNITPPLSPEFEEYALATANPGQNLDYHDLTLTSFGDIYPHDACHFHPASWPPSGLDEGQMYAPLPSVDNVPVEEPLSLMDVPPGTTGIKPIDDRRNHRSSTDQTTTQDFQTVTGKSSRSSRPIPRTLKPASEKPKENGLGALSDASCGRKKAKNKPETYQPRNHYLYKATAGRDGLYHCPFAKETQCAHPPTKQKCGYDKYLDSHLKPYQCKSSGCQDLKFSSNACLFRHEREAHGMHFYGKNPHHCLFAGCERAIDGFPRRWNLHDHMRRVHKYDAVQAKEFKENNKDPPDVSNKRKGSDASSNELSSYQMKRTSSNQAKARAASASYSRDQPDDFAATYRSMTNWSQNVVCDGDGFEIGTQDTRQSRQDSINLAQHIPPANLDPQASHGYLYTLNS